MPRPMSLLLQLITRHRNIVQLFEVLDKPEQLEPQIMPWRTFGLFFAAKAGDSHGVCFWRQHARLH